jgi:hypothetical protein
MIAWQPFFVSGNCEGLDGWMEVGQDIVAGHDRWHEAELSGHELFDEECGGHELL